MSRPASVPETSFASELANAMLEAASRRDGKLAYSVEEAGTLLSLGKTKAYDLVARGVLPSISIDGSRRVTLSQILGFLAECEANERRKR